MVGNAGGRVTDDVLRSLALSTQALGVDTVVATPYLEPLKVIAGFVYDVATGDVDDVLRHERA